MKKIILLVALSLSLHAKTQSIVFGAGCFWGVEKYFDNLYGVVNAQSGYAGGDYANPTYKTVLKYKSASKDITNHTEVVEVIYDDNKIKTKTLIKAFWELHNPTQGNRQGNDRGNNYRSALYYTNDTQKEIALETKRIYQSLLKKAGYRNITTEIKPLEKFYKAEGYHQDYLLKNPRGYCPNHSTGVKFDEEPSPSTLIQPLGGKEIIVIDAAHCLFCEKFKKEVTAQYKGTIPLRAVKEKTLKGFTIKSNVLGTPTILFIVDGVEVNSHSGFLNERKFYRAVGKFKLGEDSKAFDVAFKKSTDRKFCKQYEEFKHTKDGVFIDKVSGDILFDTKDRFNSGSGWLSFYKAVDGSTIKKSDHAFGMRRVEVIAKKSGAHLGHVFNDAPGGKQRFCINATILEFVKREDLK